MQGGAVGVSCTGVDGLSGACTAPDEGPAAGAVVGLNRQRKNLRRAEKADLVRFLVLRVLRRHLGLCLRAEFGVCGCAPELPPG